jgi:hypothetical protein
VQRAAIPAHGDVCFGGACRRQRFVREHPDISVQRTVEPLDAGEIGLGQLDRRHSFRGDQQRRLGDRSYHRRWRHRPAVDDAGSLRVLLAGMAYRLRYTVLFSLAVAFPAAAQTPATPGSVTPNGIVTLGTGTPGATASPATANRQPRRNRH